MMSIENRHVQLIDKSNSAQSHVFTCCVAVEAQTYAFLSSFTDD